VSGRDHATLAVRAVKGAGILSESSREPLKGQAGSDSIGLGSVRSPLAALGGMGLGATVGTWNPSWGPSSGG
jgi:hypothetical protein